MKRYNDIVVGSGISGLTMSLLLAMNGHKVLLVEKNAHIGGALARFYKQGVPFDNGFHFSGGLNRNEILYDMLTVLGMNQYIRPIYYSSEQANCFVFESEQKIFEIPYGIKALRQRLKDYFPGEDLAIDRYFDMVLKVFTQTASMNIRRMTDTQPTLEEDFISLQQVLDSLTSNHLLKGLLSGYSMLYGVKPAEFSFANHSRVCINLYESMARVENGGDAFIQAFNESSSNLDIEIACNNYLTDFNDINNKNIGRFLLNSGEEVAADRCIFTIHPQEILNLLPQKYLTKAFIDRVSGFEPSAGFFSLGGIINFDRGEANIFKPSIVSLCPSSDMNLLLDSQYKGLPSLIILKNLEIVKGKPQGIINALELSSPDHVTAWEDSEAGRRPSEYLDYKQQRIESIVERICGFYPDLKNNLKVVTAASVLTYRDYLHTPDGSAYGIKQKIGQYSLFGRLPFQNLYVAGQSSLLPGLIGAMISSFLLGGKIIGQERYNKFIEQRLTN